MACWYSNCDTPQRKLFVAASLVYICGVSNHRLLSHKKHLEHRVCCHDSWLNPITMMTGFLTRTARGTSLGRQGRWTISPWISPMLPAGTVDVFTCFHHFEQPKLRPVNWGRNSDDHPKQHGYHGWIRTFVTFRLLKSYEISISGGEIADFSQAPRSPAALRRHGVILIVLAEFLVGKPLINSKWMWGNSMILPSELSNSLPWKERSTHFE